MTSFILLTPDEVRTELGQRIQTLRLAQNLTQTEVGARAGLSRSTIRKLETTGEVALDVLVRVATILGRVEDLESVFLPKAALSIAELERQSVVRQRARPRAKKS